MCRDIIVLARGKYVNTYMVHPNEITETVKSSQSREKKYGKLGNGEISRFRIPNNDIKETALISLT